ncbi:hypothetical protein [Parasitella parasitica]|uniref:Retrotransposon gag domain-containing protein n=1 Tax=Parasitella parasitica TaxID=35722 RepID=A0A0B7NAS1_9FUNG|nr:hypothetical protein [Parasitella parasitica]
MREEIDGAQIAVHFGALCLLRDTCLHSFLYVFVSFLVSKQSVKLSGDRVAASFNNVSTSGESGAGISLSKRDLPKFQLKSAATKYFPGEESYDSVFHFLRIFEKVVSSSGNDVETVWKRYLPLTIPYEYDLWLKQELLACVSWKEAQESFVKKFNNSLLRLNARRAVQSACMLGGETSEAYFNRFSRACVEAGYDLCDTSIADAFLNGFPDHWQIQITALLCTSFPGVTSWTTQQVASCAINILSTIKCPLTIVGRASAAAAATPNGKGGSGSGAGGAGSGGGNKSFGSYKKSSSGSTVSSDTGKRNGGPIPATGRSFCSHCGVKWFAGHKCPEYYAFMKNKMHVLSVKASDEKRANNKKKRSHKRHGQGKQGSALAVAQTLLVTTRNGYVKP